MKTETAHPDSYRISCFRDEKHGERFSITLFAKSQPVFLTHWLTEAKVRDAMVTFGVPEYQTEHFIRVAQEHAKPS